MIFTGALILAGKGDEVIGFKQGTPGDFPGQDQMPTPSSLFGFFHLILDVSIDRCQLTMERCLMAAFLTPSPQL